MKGNSHSTGTFLQPAYNDGSSGENSTGSGRDSNRVYKMGLGLRQSSNWSPRLLSCRTELCSVLKKQV